MKMSRRARAITAAGAAALVAVSSGACGVATSLPSVGSESHFLAHCEATCADGLDCIGGICTRGCLTAAADCTDLDPAATCTNQSVEPGAVAVCDVPCSGSADCGRLGSEFTCAAAFCRDDMAAPPDAGPSLPPALPPECDAYRDVPSALSVSVSIVNERTETIYLKPYLDHCNDLPRLVDWDGFNLHGYRCAISCQEILESGTYPGPPCGEECTTAPLVRLEPGATLAVGTFESIQTSHGIDPATERMPGSCGSNDPGFGYACFSRAPIAPGEYQLSAQALLDPGCPEQPAIDDEECNCTPSEQGSCETGAEVYSESEPLVGDIVATTSMSVEDGAELRVVFR